MNIVWIGCHSEGLPAFEAVLSSGRHITRFITLTEDAYAKRSAASRKYIDLCQMYSVPVSYISTIKNQEAFDCVKEAAPDLLFVIGWSEIIPPDILDLATIGTVGTHAAMLPHNRGSAPVNWAIIRGETMSGNTMMWLDKDVDAGNIIDQIPFPILPYDTCKTIYDKVAETNKIMLLRLLERLENGLGPVMDKPNITEEEILPRRRPKDGLLDWSTTAKQAYDFIRALVKPYPCAFTYYNGKKYLVLSATLVPDDKQYAKPGEILGKVYSTQLSSCGLQVSCGTGSLLIHCMEDEDGTIYQGETILNSDFVGSFENT